MTQKLKIGFIGAGFIGQLAHMMNYAEVPECELYALAEYRPLLRDKVLKRYDITKGYENHLNLLADPEVDAVVVVTPRQHTAPTVKDCLEAKKHVISEKPMAGNSQQGLELVNLAKLNNCRYLVGHMKRFDEGIQKAKAIFDELISSKELGSIVHARSHCYMGSSYCNAYGHVTTDETVTYTNKGWNISPDWLPQKHEQQFARFLNVFSHNTNLIRYFFGKSPNIEYVTFDHPLAQTCVLSYDDFNVNLDTGETNTQYWDEGLEIIFEKGRLNVKIPPALLRNVPATIELYKGNESHSIEIPISDWSWAFKRQAEAVVSDILNDNQSLIEASEALKDLDFIEALWKQYLGLETT